MVNTVIVNMSHDVFLPQGRVDAVWALLRRQYDRVSLMRPTAADQVNPNPNQTQTPKPT